MFGRPVISGFLLCSRALSVRRDAHWYEPGVWSRARPPRIASNPLFVRGECAAAVCSSDRMAIQATPGSEMADKRAGSASSPGALQAGIQGRESELRLIGSLLDAVAFGSGAVIVVEGASGIGKSRLLLEGVRDATRRGMRFGISTAEPEERTVELAALLAALFDGAEPLIARDALSSIRAERGSGSGSSASSRSC